MKIPSSIAVAAFAVALSSCSGSRQEIPPISLQDKLAVVAFHFDGFSDPAATPEGRRVKERGPGDSPRADPSSLADEQVALDSVWTRFSAGIPAALGASIVPTGEVVANPAYAGLPGKVPAGLEPVGLKPVSIADTAGLRNLAAALDARRLLLVEG